MPRPPIYASPAWAGTTGTTRMPNTGTTFRIIGRVPGTTSCLRFQRLHLSRTSLPHPQPGLIDLLLRLHSDRYLPVPNGDHRGAQLRRCSPFLSSIDQDPGHPETMPQETIDCSPRPRHAVPREHKYDNWHRPATQRRIRRAAVQRTASWRQARNLRAYPNPDTMEILWNSPKQEEEGPQLGTILPSEAKLSEKDDREISHN